ncbi:unnamed protein product [Prunus armeniaca]
MSLVKDCKDELQNIRDNGFEALLDQIQVDAESELKRGSFRCDQGHRCGACRKHSDAKVSDRVNSQVKFEKSYLLAGPRGVSSAVDSCPDRSRREFRAVLSEPAECADWSIGTWWRRLVSYQFDQHESVDHAKRHFSTAHWEESPKFPIEEGLLGWGLACIPELRHSDPGMSVVRHMAMIGRERHEEWGKTLSVRAGHAARVVSEKRDPCMPTFRHER